MSPLWVGWTLLAFLLPLASPSPLYGLLIVTGDVTHNSARVLVQALPEAPAFPDFAAQPRLPLPSQCASARMTVEFDSRDGLVSFTPISVTLDATPKVFVVTGLPESTSVRVSWRKDDQRLPACEWSLIGEEAASFRTLPTPGRAESVTVAALSCDRSIENKDYEFLSVLSPGAGALPVPSIHITAHIGDQLYADALTSAVLSSNTSIPFPALVASYRSLYPLAWRNPAHASIFRSGGHWMLPDDHDLINNADARMMGCLRTGESLDIPEGSAPQLKRCAMVAASAIAVLEYQTALTVPLFPAAPPVATQAESKDAVIIDLEIFEEAPTGWESTLQLLVHQSGTHPTDISVFRTVGSTGYALVDTRIDRVFARECGGKGGECQPTKWISQRTLHRLRSELEAWSSDPNVDSIVIMSGTPILFMSTEAARVAMSFENERYSMYPDEQNTTRELMDLIWEHRSKVKLLVGGDVHLFSESSVCAGEPFGAACVPQVITSGVSAGSDGLHSPHLFLFQTFNQWAFVPSLGPYTCAFGRAPAQNSMGNSFLLIQSAGVDTRAECGVKGGSTEGNQCWWREDQARFERHRPDVFTPGSPTQIIDPASGWRGGELGTVRWHPITRVRRGTAELLLQEAALHPHIALIVTCTLSITVCAGGCACLRSLTSRCQRRRRVKTD